MNERWRKKLRGIDQVGPSDDVYQRAKRGPALPEPQSPMQRTSTRVVTAMAAFTVFALAISLFVIPALRLSKESQAGAGGRPLPLWPVQTTDAVGDLQAQADAGQASWALDPREVAARFGRDVLGWNDVVVDPGIASSLECGGTIPGDYPSDSAPSTAVPAICSQDAVGVATDLPCRPPISDVSIACSSGSASGSSAPVGFVRYRLWPCDPQFCDLRLSVDQVVDLFQPAGEGAGRVWAVLDATSDSMGISLAPGTELRDGSMVYASGAIVDRTEALLGYHLPDECGGSGSTTGFETTNDEAGSDVVGGSSSGTYARGQIGIDLSDAHVSCDAQPGYVFVAVTDTPLDPQDLSTTDPLGGLPPDVSVLALIAVPVTFRFAGTEEGSGSATAGALQTGWISHKDPAGWTIDVPSSWSVRRLDGSDAKGTYEGAAFGSAPLDQYPGGPTTIGAPPGEVSLLLYHGTCTVCLGPGPKAPSDDSRLPLAITDMDTVDGGFLRGFQADGLLFTLSIRVGGDAPTPEQMSILEQMVSSIAFEPWQPDEERNGWIALHPTDEDGATSQDAMISWQSCDQAGCYVLVYGDYGPGGSGPYVLGPIPPCGEGQNMTADPSSLYRIVLECPDGTTQAWGAPGEPSPDNTPAYDHALDPYPTIHAWDGTLLTNVTGEKAG